MPDGRGIRNAFLSKLPFTENPHDITEFPREGLETVARVDDEGRPTEVRTLGRGGLHVTVEPEPGFTLHLINAHLKSKLLTYPKHGRDQPRFQPHDEDERAKMAAIALLKRTAEATALRVEANKLLESDTGEALIVLSDFNHVVEAATTQIVKGPPGSEIDSTPRAFNTPDKGDKTRLFNLAPLILEDRRYSRVHKHMNERKLAGVPRLLEPSMLSHKTAQQVLGRRG
ncbi:hypothetical protein BH24DEI2_BH24DEI2_24850 [soil metagenome]